MPTATRKRAKVKAQAPDPLAQLIQISKEAVRRGCYQMAGYVGRFYIQAGAETKLLNLKENAIAVGYIGDATDVHLIALNEWRGLPKFEPGEEFCPACLATCEQCQGSKTFLCVAYQCGGSGKVPQPAVPCPARGCLADCEARAQSPFWQWMQRNLRWKLRTGPKPRCQQCRGTGMFAEFTRCSVCAGSGKVDCTACRGLGRRPTGLKDGSFAYGEAPKCDVCQGKRRKLIASHDQIAAFITGTQKDFQVIGPVVAFELDLVNGGLPRIIRVPEDGDGNQLVLLVNEAREEVFFVGGRILLTRESDLQ